MKNLINNENKKIIVSEAVFNSAKNAANDGAKRY